MFLVLGVGAGAVYAAIGLGLVLTWRASRVVNFAHGAMAMYATYVFVELRVAGDLILPVVGIPARVHLAPSVAFFPALVVATAVAGALGLAVHGLVFRPLARAGPLARVVASVGLAGRPTAWPRAAGSSAASSPAWAASWSRRSRA